MLPELTQKMVSQGFPMENQNNIVNEPIIYYPMYWPGTKQCPKRREVQLSVSLKWRLSSHL